MDGATVMLIGFVLFAVGALVLAICMAKVS